MSPKSGFGYTSFDDKIYVAGGNDGKSILSDFDEYNTFKNSATSLPKMITNRDEIGVTKSFDEEEIYAIGGFGGKSKSCLKSCERFSFERKCWEGIADLNSPRRALAAVCLKNGVYAIGGFNGTNYLATVEKYDAGANRWDFVASMKCGRCMVQAVASEDGRGIWVIGGFNNQPVKMIEYYDSEEDKWVTKSFGNKRRYMHSAIIA